MILKRGQLLKFAVHMSGFLLLNIFQTTGTVLWKHINIIYVHYYPCLLSISKSRNRYIPVGINNEKIFVLNCLYLNHYSLVESNSSKL